MTDWLWAVEVVWQRNGFNNLFLALAMAINRWIYMSFTLGFTRSFFKPGFLFKTRSSTASGPSSLGLIIKYLPAGNYYGDSVSLVVGMWRLSGTLENYRRVIVLPPGLGYGTPFWRSPDHTVEIPICLLNNPLMGMGNHQGDWRRRISPWRLRFACLATRS